MSVQIKNNLNDILSKIQASEKKAGRTNGSVKLCAVSKFHPAESMIEAINCGQVLFGENRVQEASSKFDFLTEKGLDFKMHIIGSLQRNKVKEAVRIADCIQSVDRIELLEEIEKQCAKISKKIEVLFELHTGEESKAGFENYQSLAEAVKLCAEGKFSHVIPKGIMTMAPNTNEQSLVRKSFSAARETLDKLKADFPAFEWTELSMGMSGDFEIAIEEGSTMVRVGTAIFGERDYTK